MHVGTISFLLGHMVDKFEESMQTGRTARIGGFNYM